MEKNTKNKKTGKLLEGEDIPLLSENEKRELVSLVKDKNISMDFILEMKEAFLLFDKVRLKMFNLVIKLLTLYLSFSPVVRVEIMQIYSWILIYQVHANEYAKNFLVISFLKGKNEGYKIQRNVFVLFGNQHPFILLTNLIEILTTMDSFLLFAQNLEFRV